MMALNVYDIGLKRICDAWAELADSEVYHPGRYTKRDKARVAEKVSYKLFDEIRDIGYDEIRDAVIDCINRYDLYKKTSYFNNVPEKYRKGAAK